MCQVSYKCKHIRTPDYSTEKFKARSAWKIVFQILKHQNCQFTLLYPVKCSIKVEGEMKTCHDENRLKE